MDLARDMGTGCTRVGRRSVRRPSQKGDSDFYGVGGNVLKAPDAIKAASVLFVLLGGGTGEKWTVVRRQFSGDKLTGSSQQDFLVRPGAGAFQ